jgi:hypothetical protein
MLRESHVGVDVREHNICSGPRGVQLHAGTIQDVTNVLLGARDAIEVMHTAVLRPYS